MTHGLLVVSLFSVLMLSDVTGKWGGTFEVRNDQGEQRTEKALLILKQEGTTVTGSGGPDERERHPIQNGKVEGDKLTFEIGTDSSTIYFNLTVSGDEIKGEMKRRRNGQEQTARLSVKRHAE